MRILVIHTETHYFGGTQRMLGHFLEELDRRDCDAVVSLAENSKVKEVVPAGVEVHTISGNQPFSLAKVWRQLTKIRELHRKKPVNLIHAWAARDWELAALAGLLLRCPAVGTLHDHPKANFHSSQRQRLMALSARRLDALVCVSQAVKHACEQVGYTKSKLSVIHNGLPEFYPTIPKIERPVVRFGYLGSFSELKGLKGLLDILEHLSKKQPTEWEMWIAGGAQDEEGKALVEQLRSEYGKASWWPRVRWLGWVKDPNQFFESIDLLIFPSQEFDSFPTVLLEAGMGKVPVLAAKVGGVPEIISNGESGWLFEPGDWKQAAHILNGLLSEPWRLRNAGQKAFEKIDREFSSARMVENYLNIYLRFKHV